MRIFRTCDILLPALGTDMTRWACVACDQFTSEPDYWQRAEALVGGANSTLRLILPEAYLGRRDESAETEKIAAAMERYLREGVFREIKDSFVYVERTLSSGAVRRGLVGALDLEQYDWAEGTRAPIRATEGTVEDRLPPRVKVRMGAALELPHIMVFIDDPTGEIIPSTAGGEALYDFELMLGGGHIRGSRVSGEAAVAVSARIEALPGEIKFAMGDGNHSLAAAKRCWEAVKPTLGETQRESHPARFALVELVNLHDDAVTFEPIHRLLLGVDGVDFAAAARAALPRREDGYPVTLLTGDRRETLRVDAPSIGALIGAVERVCKDYVSVRGGSIDYIHGDRETEQLSAQSGCAGVLLPAMEKGELFPSVEKTGPFPKKSFSIGLGPDKRYYLECRKIK